MSHTFHKPLEFLEFTKDKVYKSPERSVDPALMNKILIDGQEAVEIVDRLASDLQFEFLDYNVEFKKYWQNSGKIVKYFWIKLRKREYENHHTIINVAFDYYSDELIIMIAVEFRRLGADKLDYIKHLKLLKDTSVENGFVYRTVKELPTGNISFKADTAAELRSKMSGDMYPQIAYCIPKEDVYKMTDEELLSLIIQKVKEIEKYYLHVVKE